MAGMKRIKYISRFAKDLGREDIDALIARSAEKNATLEITGFLMTSGQLFMQVIEGPDAHVDDLFKNIAQDGRHQDILILEYETDVRERYFPDWSMKKFDLDADTDKRLAAARKTLAEINRKRREVDILTLRLERAILEELTS